MSRDTSMHVVSPHNFLRSGEKLCRRLPACKFVSEVNLKEATFQNQHSLPDSSPPRIRELEGLCVAHLFS